MRVRFATTHPTAWFGLGVFASWAAGFSLISITVAEPGRWESESGLFAGLIGSLLVASVMAALFRAWILGRRRGRTTLRLSFLVPLAFGLLHSWVGIALALGLSSFLGRHPAVAIACLLGVFGSPLVFGELCVRLSAADST